jgi:hypothetical protein
VYRVNGKLGLGAYSIVVMGNFGGRIKCNVP